MAAPNTTFSIETGHLVLMSIGVLVGMAFLLQGIGNASPAAHTLIVVLLVGVILILGMRASSAGPENALAKLPWLPAPQGG